VLDGVPDLTMATGMGSTFDDAFAKLLWPLVLSGCCSCNIANDNDRDNSVQFIYSFISRFSRTACSEMDWWVYRPKRRLCSGG